MRSVSRSLDSAIVKFKCGKVAGLLGRSKRSDVVVDFPTVSRNHCVFTRYDDGSWTVSDAASKDGVYVNGKRVSICALEPEDTITIGGIEFVIHPTAEAFDVEIPALNAVYTHMLGHDCHSIVAGADHADAMIAQLEGYIARGYDLILTSHYTPEDWKDARTKIDYLKELKPLAAVSGNRDSFLAAMKEKYPQYSGENYLSMTAGFFFA